MLKKKIEKAFNKQINAETWSAYLYWSMATWFDAQGLKGFANWMRCQAQEEMVHAMKFYTFLHDRGGRVLLGAMEEPPGEWDSALAVFQAAYEHECYVTGRINDLVDLAGAEKDHAAAAFLQWFVTEQVEEEASASEIVQMLEMAGPKGRSLLMLDREVGARRSFSASGD